MARYFSKYSIAATMNLPITDEVSAQVGPDLRGVLLGLVEVYQHQARWADAIACLERLKRLESDDMVVKLSVAELLLDVRPGDKNVCRKGVRLAEGIENETSVHTALLLYKARALRGLGLLDAARETLTGALRRKKGRSDLPGATHLLATQAFRTRSPANRRTIPRCRCCWSALWRIKGGMIPRKRGKLTCSGWTPVPSIAV